MSDLSITINESTLRSLVIAYLQEQLGDAGGLLKPEDIKIEVKSKQNYRSEWETASFRAVVNKTF